MCMFFLLINTSYLLIQCSVPPRGGITNSSINHHHKTRMLSLRYDFVWAGILDENVTRSS